MDDLAKPYRAEFGAVHHEDAPGFLFTVAPTREAAAVARAMNKAAAYDALLSAHASALARVAVLEGKLAVVQEAQCCQRCGSLWPERHPVGQLGAEVSPCPHPWHDRAALRTEGEGQAAKEQGNGDG